MDGAGQQSYIISLVEELAQTREFPSTLYLLHLCFRSDRTVAAAASAAIRRLLEGLPPLKFAYLDQVMRKLSPVYRFPELKRGELGKVRVADRDAPFVLGLTSFHSDGYIREEALRRLALGRSGAELPFLLIRMNDWVKEIRLAAREGFPIDLSLITHRISS